MNWLLHSKALSVRRFRDLVTGSNHLFEFCCEGLGLRGILSWAVLSRVKCIDPLASEYRLDVRNWPWMWCVYLIGLFFSGH